VLSPRTLLQVLEILESGETTVAAIPRELGIQRTAIRRWVKLPERGSTTAVGN